MPSFRHAAHTARRLRSTRESRCQMLLRVSLFVYIYYFSFWVVILGLQLSVCILFFCWHTGHLYSPQLTEICRNTLAAWTDWMAMQYENVPTISYLSFNISPFILNVGKKRGGHTLTISPALAMENSKHKRKHHKLRLRGYL